MTKMDVLISCAPCQNLCVLQDCLDLIIKAVQKPLSRSLLKLPTTISIQDTVGLQLLAFALGTALKKTSARKIGLQGQDKVCA